MDDKRLWEKARARVNYKKHFQIYAICNLLIWIFWILGNLYTNSGWEYPWPIFPTLGWGIALAFEHFEAYHKSFDEQLDKEYKKLKKVEREFKKLKEQESRSKTGRRADDEINGRDEIN